MKVTQIVLEGCEESGARPLIVRMIDLSRLLCLLTIMGLPACLVSNTSETPEEIMGTWETSAPGYKDCYFEITRSRVVFTNPITKPSVNVIRKIERAVEGKCTMYHITYEDEEKLDYSFSIYYCRADSEETIFFKNLRKVIWKRKFVPGEPAFSSNNPRVWGMAEGRSLPARNRELDLPGEHWHQA